MSMSLTELSSCRSLLQLYADQHDNICVMFASIPGFWDFYHETDINSGGLECLRLLNEIIADFDEVGYYECTNLTPRGKLCVCVCVWVCGYVCGCVCMCNLTVKPSINCTIPVVVLLR